MFKQSKRIVLLVFATIVIVFMIFPAYGDVTDIVEIDTLPTDSIYSKIWQPFIAKWTDEHYVTSYGLQLRDKGDMGDLVCSISKDRGKTWSPPIMIFDHRVPNGSVRYAYNNSVSSIHRGKTYCGALRCGHRCTSATAKTRVCVRPTLAMEVIHGRTLNSRWTTMVR